MPNSFNTALQGAFGKIATHQNNIQSTNAAINRAGVNSAMGAFGKIATYQDDLRSTNAAIDAASPFGPVASNFAHNPDNLYSAMARASAGAPLVQGVADDAAQSSNVLDLPFEIPTSAPDVSGSQLSPETLDYLNAELAASYGMDRTTAYQEALSNTSYQRAVRDMQAAGLNPAALFGSGRSSGAGGVAYASVDGSSGSGGSGGSGSGKLFSKGVYSALSTAAGIATAIVTGRMGNFWIGQTTARGIMSALDGFF